MALRKNQGGRKTKPGLTRREMRESAEMDRVLQVRKESKKKKKNRCHVMVEGR